jgi:hypothetical protein
MAAVFRQGASILLLLVGLSACVPAGRIGGQAAPQQVGREQRIASLETALADALIQIEKLKAHEEESGGSDQMPPDARDGYCYARMLVPAQYVKRTEQRIVKEATERQETVPARLQWVEERILVSEEHVQIRVVPATYKWVEERIEVMPARSRQELVKPARYKTVTEQVPVTPETTEWRPGRGTNEKIDEETGEIIHQVRIPPTYRDVKKKVLAEPPVYRKVIEPAVYEVTRKKVVDVPEHTEKVVVPAEYKTVRVQKVVVPEKVVRHRVPPVYESFSYREKVADEKLDWRRILCVKDKTESRIRKLQSALNAAGYDAGYADGIIGKKTKEAVHRFQTDRGLATGRLSVETFDALQVPY